MWSGRIALIIIRPINLSITAKRQLNVNLKLGSHCSNNELLSHYTEITLPVLFSQVVLQKRIF